MFSKPLLLLFLIAAPAVMSLQCVVGSAKYGYRTNCEDAALKKQQQESRPSPPEVGGKGIPMDDDVRPDGQRRKSADSNKERGSSTPAPPGKSEEDRIGDGLANPLPKIPNFGRKRRAVLPSFQTPSTAPEFTACIHEQENNNVWMKCGHMGDCGNGTEKYERGRTTKCCAEDFCNTATTHVFPLIALLALFIGH